MTAAPPLLTVEALDALPADGVDRWLIRGHLREQPMTQRNRFHARSESRTSHVLETWMDAQPEPRGQVFSGEVGCILRRDPDTSYGIDVAYFSADVKAAQTPKSSKVVGAPTVAVEILSPTDTHQDVSEKVDEYLDAGVPHVWVVDPHFRTVTVFAPGRPPRLLAAADELTAEPELPGFRTAVARLFAG